jgi:hypothetical protein
MSQAQSSPIHDSEPVLERIAFHDMEFLAQNAQLRRLQIGGREVMRSVGLVIRDGFWGTHRLQQQQCETWWEGEHWRRHIGGFVQGTAGSALHWHLNMNVHRDGMSVSAELRAAEDFQTCRAGLMLLHPLCGVVGAPVTVIHNDGSRRSGSFPDLISPPQPFFDIQGLIHSPAENLTLEWRLSGDVFEMEDQRNWSDASFKTYNRPLAWPCPYVIGAGEQVEQRIELRVLRHEVRQS